MQIWQTQTFSNSKKSNSQQIIQYLISNFMILLVANIIKMIQNCHLCMMPNSNFKAKCCIPRCGKYYCIDCIKQKFDEQYQESTYNKEFWICYSCQKKCDCQICNGLKFQRKRGRKKQTPEQKALKDAQKILAKKAKSQMVQSFNKNKQKQNEEEQQDPYDIQEINKEAPLVRRLLLRKKMFYQMMKKQFDSKNMCKASHSQQIKRGSINIGELKQTQMPATLRAIDKLIGNTIKDYDQDEEELDIQILD